MKAAEFALEGPRCGKKDNVAPKLIGIPKYEKSFPEYSDLEKCHNIILIKATG